MLGIKIYRQDKSHSAIILEGSGLYCYSFYPKIYIKDESVNIDSLEKEMVLVLNALTSIAFELGLKGFIITSGNDGSHGGSSGTNSLHYKNRAIDISFREAIKNSQIKGINSSSGIVIQKLRAKFPKNYDIIIEKDHLHIEYDPKSYVSTVTLGVKKTSNNESVVWVSEPIKYIHSDVKITTLSDLLKTNPLFNRYKEDLNKLLNFKGNTNKTNRERIESMYLQEDVFDTLKLNTLLYLDPEMIDRDFIFRGKSDKVIDISSFPIFYGGIREELEKDPDYVQSEYYLQNNSYPVEYINSLLSVVIYCKSLNKLIDITHLCNNVTVNSDTTISSFSLSCNMTSSIEETLSGVIITSYQNKISFLQKYISENDLIWIRFETLKNEDREELSFDSIAGKIYDFMGFINVVNEEKNIGTLKGSVNINGQCFSKLFTNDEALFLPISTIKDSSTGNLVIGSFENDSILKRVFASGQYMTLFGVQYRTIKDSILFYINQLSNTGLLPKKINDLIFQSYGDRRQKLYKLKGDNTIKDEFMSGVYQIIKVLFDKSLEERTIVDSTVTNPQGSIMSLFSNICQYPLVEFLTDTYGDLYNIVIRKPPFDYESIKSFLETDNSIYTLNESEVGYENLEFETDFYTWFEIQNKGVFYGTNEHTSLAYIPIVPLDKYIEYWGSKKRFIQSNYTRSNNLGTIEEKKQVVLDLLYVMNCDIYLPFSKKGTINLAKGDRRIKKGTWIRYKDEIFYINGVINTVSIDNNSISRNTTLKVSRGIKEEFVEGKIVDGKLMSYFKIVDFESIKQSMIKYLTTENEKRSVINRNIIVDQDVFEFFVNKKQLDEK